MTNFPDLVHQMRKAQKQYFKTRTNAALLEAKQLEQMVDEYLKAMENTTNEQPLFQEQP
jgi:hypothetical protein